MALSKLSASYLIGTVAILEHGEIFHERVRLYGAVPGKQLGHGSWKA